MKLFFYLCLMIAALTAVCSRAQAPFGREAAQDFFRPSYQGQNVDWCLNWGSRGCGQPAADAFCQMNGFAHAISFDGRLMRPTALLGENRTCDSGFCKGFTRISCAGRMDSDRRNNQHDDGRDMRREERHDGFFAMPQIDHTRVDWCLHWGSGCGRPAADRFCQQMGFSAASDFVQRPARPTLVLGDGRMCDQNTCTALEAVQCVGAQQPEHHGWDRPQGPPNTDRVFDWPQVHGIAVDRCLYNGHECDQPAADKFCSLQGYRRAVDFMTKSHAPTLILNEDRTCNDGCKAFAQIVCSNH